MSSSSTIEREVPSAPSPSASIGGGRPTLRSRWTRLPGIGLVLSWLVIITVVLWALFPGVFAPYDPYLTVVTGGLQGPSAEYWFGGDAIGRDLFSRVVYGSSESLTGSFVAVAFGLGFGTLFGVLSGAIGGLTEDIIMRFVDVLLSIPGLLLALTIIILLGPGTVNVAIAVGIGSVATFARLVRSEVVQVRRTDYVEAAYGSGGTTLHVLWHHVLPNSVRPVFALAAMQFGGAVLALSTIGFLGYGVTPPTPEWGIIISQGRNLLSSAWWVTALPGLIIVAVVLAANRISKSIAEA